MVAIFCGHGNGKFHNQYLDEITNKWVSDSDSRAICTKNKVEILEYCKKVRSALYVCVCVYVFNCEMCCVVSLDLPEEGYS